MPPFSGLEARFAANAKALYSYRSVRDKGDGSLGTQPYVIESPFSYRDVGKDSRFFPVQSTINDEIRIGGGFLSSPAGRLFLGEQVVLQAGTTFVETRVLNPLFVIGNLVPYLHLTRPLAVASDFTPSGDQSQKSPASDSTIGSAGRLQIGSANDAVARAMNNGGTSGLLSLLNPAQLLSNISGIFSLLTGGPEGINERPEFDVGGGQLYSIALWNGFQKQPWASSPFNDAAANLRKGNILGAAISLAQGISNTILGTPANSVPSLSSSGGRDSTSPWEDGRRYFITDNEDGADRYLQDSIVFNAAPDGTTVPNTNMSFLYRTAFAAPPAPDIINALPTPNNSTASSNFSTQSGLDSFINNQVNQVTTFAKNTINSIRLPISVPIGNPFTNQIAAAVPSALPSTNPASDNPAEDDMLYPDLALRNRYQNDERLSELRTAIQAQMDTSFAYWKKNLATMPHGLGFSEGDGQIGQENNRDSRVRSPNQVNLIDEINWLDIDNFDTAKGPQTQTTAQYINKLRQIYGQDLINVFLYDYVNKKTIPFRAFLTNVVETVTPEYSDTRYIGRLERNVIYVGVSRQVSFTLKIHAMSAEEMAPIWKKINYVTGLCYPADYNTGFMVPPLVKLTIGDVYRDQPGYIRALSHIIEDDTSWEITPDSQAPQGITMNITFAILEKKLMRSNSNFYPFGVPRDADQPQASKSMSPDTSISTVSAIPSAANLNLTNIKP